MKAGTKDTLEISEFLTSAHTKFLLGESKDRLKIFGSPSDKFKPFRFSVFMRSQIEWENGAGKFVWNPGQQTLFFEGKSRQALAAHNELFKPKTERWKVIENEV